MRLYSYWRSTTSYRVRIALNLKGLVYQTIPINLVKNEQSTSEYAALNPIKGVPSLVLEDGQVLTQSMAILRYLETSYSNRPLLPENPVQSAQIEAASMLIATDIHPVNNLKIIKRLKEMGHNQGETVVWMNHWIREGLHVFNALIGKGAFCFGDAPTLADLCLVPQLYNAHRWGTDLTGLNRLLEIETKCLELEAFKLAHPNNQPDAIKE